MVTRKESLKDKNDARIEGRFNVRCDAEIFPLNQITPAAGDPVTIQNVSLCGLSLRSARPFPMGSAWRLVVSSHGVNMSDVVVVVRHCGLRDDRGYDVGLSVAMEPSMLLILGATPIQIAEYVDRVVREGDLNVDLSA